MRGSRAGILARWCSLLMFPPEPMMEIRGYDSFTRLKSRYMRKSSLRLNFLLRIRTVPMLYDWDCNNERLLMMLTSVLPPPTST